MRTTSRFVMRRMTVTAIMSAVAFVLMILEFAVPLVPSFLKFDFSDLPAFITSFAIGPVYGAIVELIKNVLHLTMTTTSGVGELANFIIGACLVLPAGIIYKCIKSRKGAVIGSVSGAVTAAVVSVPVNYYITYPFYSNFMPMESIIAAYSAIFPWVDSLFKALLFVNLPFTLCKGIMTSIITFFIYKKLSPVLKGDKQ
ncbi:MAG: ECF transporter S component [Clostridia bacterium]|nr:ECF transporter S component [Clostridia bacterium]